MYPSHRPLRSRTTESEGIIRKINITSVTTANYTPVEKNPSLLHKQYILHISISNYTILLKSVRTQYFLSNISRKNLEPNPRNPLGRIDLTPPSNLIRCLTFQNERNCDRPRIPPKGLGAISVLFENSSDVVPVLTPKRFF